MKTDLLKRVRIRLRARLWFVPALSALVAFAAAKGLVLLDRSLIDERDAWFLFGGGADGAREVLSTIASSMMSFTGLVFSITILVLQQASSQFSPRVLRTFLEDRGTKLAMSAFVGTFVFAMALLPEVRGAFDEQDRFIPALSVYTAFGLILVSVGIFIHYIDHMAHAVRAITIIKRIGSETRESIERLYPDDVLEGPTEPVRAPAEAPSAVVEFSGSAGVLTSVDEEQLMQLALRTPAVIGVVPSPGEFVPGGAPLFRIWCTGDGPSADELRECVVVGNERTIYQDPAFGFRQLVDIAERALSPGVNDPSTAVQALDEIHDLLRRLTQRRFPSPRRVDEQGQLRLILPRPAWRDYVDLALSEIRQYGSQSIQVASRMRALLDDCIGLAVPRRKRYLEDQLRFLDEAVQRELESNIDRKLARQPTR